MTDKDDPNAWLARAMQGDSAKAAAAAREAAMPAILEHAKTLAAIRRAHYEASLAKGFTPQEALVLCMNHGLGGPGK